MAAPGEPDVRLNPETPAFIPTPSKKGAAQAQEGEKYQHDETVADIVLRQVEYHFSDANLAMDNYLLSRMHEDPEFWVPVKVVASLSKIRMYTDDELVVLDALRKCPTLQLDEEERKVRRPGFRPPMPKQHKDLRRTIFLFGLPPQFDQARVAELCVPFGVVKQIIFDDMEEDAAKPLADGEAEDDKGAAGQEGDKNESTKPTLVRRGSVIQELQPPSRDIALLIMAKKFAHTPPSPGAALPPGSPMESAMSPPAGTLSVDTTEMPGGDVRVVPSPNAFPHPIPNPNGKPMDFSHLRSCFVVFESQSQANKCVRARARANDGIRALHQYDYNKECKKNAAAKAGMSPLYSSSSAAYATPRFSPAALASPPMAPGRRPDWSMYRPPQRRNDGRFPQPSRRHSDAAHRERRTSWGRENGNAQTTRHFGRRKRLSSSHRPWHRPQTSHARMSDSHRFSFAGQGQRVKIGRGHADNRNSWASHGPTIQYRHSDGSQTVPHRAWQAAPGPFHAQGFEWQHHAPYITPGPSPMGAGPHMFHSLGHQQQMFYGPPPGYGAQPYYPQPHAQPHSFVAALTPTMATVPVPSSYVMEPVSKGHARMDVPASPQPRHKIGRRQVHESPGTATARRLLSMQL